MHGFACRRSQVHKKLLEAASNHRAIELRLGDVDWQQLSSVSLGDGLSHQLPPANPQEIPGIDAGFFCMPLLVLCQ